MTYNYYNLYPYNYKVTDNTFSSKYLKLILLKINSLIPSYLTPNMITTIGFMFIFLTLFTKNILINTCLILLYTIFDCIDGIRARLTGKSSPFGELLDHTLDSFTCIFVSIVIYKTFDMPFNWLWYLTITMTKIFQYFHLRALKDGNIIFNSLIGPTEQLLILCTLMIIKYFIDINLNFIYILNLSGYLFMIVTIYLFVVNTNMYLQSLKMLIFILLSELNIFLLFINPNKNIIYDGIFICFCTFHIMISKLTKTIFPNYVYLLLIGNILLKNRFSFCLNMMSIGYEMTMVYHILFI